MKFVPCLFALTIKASSSIRATSISSLRNPKLEWLKSMPSFYKFSKPLIREMPSFISWSRFLHHLIQLFARSFRRCVDIGKYHMIGSNNRTCIRSRWTGQKPHCYGLNQENDYAMEKAPTVLFRHHNGPIAQSNDGRLIVYPGTTVSAICKKIILLDIFMLTFEIRFTWSACGCADLEHRSGMSVMNTCRFSRSGFKLQTIP